MSLRVLIVDDSPFVREVLRAQLSSFDDVDIVGEAGNGQRALELVEALEPDVVTMDVLMPMVDGFEAIRKIIAQCPTPIVVVADPSDGVDRLAMAALEAGAIDVFPKPRGGLDRRAAGELVELLRVAAATDMEGYTRPPPRRALPAGFEPRLASARVVALVASTGGPQTIRSILERMPELAVPMLVVQHTAIGCTAAFVSWCGEATKVKVVVAKGGVALERGCVYVAPDDRHLLVDSRGSTRLSDDAPLSRHRPSGTRLLESVAAEYGRSAVGVVLTGMGNDGAAGLDALEAAGGLAIIQDPKSAIIDGMPRAAIARTRAPYVATVGEIAAAIGRCGGKRP